MNTENLVSFYSLKLKINKVLAGQVEPNYQGILEANAVECYDRIIGTLLNSTRLVQCCHWLA